MLRQEPAPIRTIGSFVAPNPWTSAKQETWSLEHSRWVTRFALSKQTSSAPNARTIFKGDGSPLVVLKSHSDGRLYTVPYSLFELLPGEEIELSDLPELLHRLGDVKKYDFIPPERNMGVMLLSSILIFVFLLVEIFIVPKMRPAPSNGVIVHAILLPILILGMSLMWVGIARLRRYSRHSKAIRDFLQKRKKR
ncbi:hypothetical protein FCE95_13920 [Luteimonas gilva]|uniref:Uncharacterized protein n=1 Tax=Luteimonas gilva TaxID=2572684 RepID=A0A4U5JLZ4_9GAMM|nr:hypothetical protein [Luteimonas gilva]TKR29258.1 hypothetical protein FCE95_13920 [Luteimonas gilva]